MITPEIGYQSISAFQGKLQFLPERSLANGGIVRCESINYSLIDQVHVNPALQSFLPREIARLFTEDELIRLVRLPALYNGDNTESVPCPEEYGRALPLGYGNIPYADRFVGKVITGKGVGLSGFNYFYDAQKPTYADPTGYFGSKDAEFDTDASNLAIDCGLRAALSLGYIVLNPEKLKLRISNSWRKKQSEKYFLPQLYARQAIDCVVKNGDVPAVQLRLGGNLKRISITQFAGKKTERFGEKTALSYGADNLLLEAHFFPQNFAQYCRTIPMNDVLSALDLVRRRQSLTVAKRDSLNSFLIDLYDDQVRRIHDTQPYVTEYFDSVNSSSFLPKDTDFTLKLYDFEKQTDFPTNKYQLVKNLQASFDQYFQILCRHYLRNPYSTR